MEISRNVVNQFTSVSKAKFSFGCRRIKSRREVLVGPNSYKFLYCKNIVNVLKISETV